MFFFYGCLFHWFSKMQRSVTLSSAEAEFFGTMLAAKEVIFIRELLIDLGFIIDAASVIKCDSKSAVGMAFDPVAFKKTKHILRAAEFLRDLVTREVVSVEHISGVVMLADILTKAASRGVFVDLINGSSTLLHDARWVHFVPRARTRARRGCSRALSNPLSLPAPAHSTCS